MQPGTARVLVLGRGDEGRVGLTAGYRLPERAPLARYEGHRVGVYPGAAQVQQVVAARMVAMVTLRGDARILGQPLAHQLPQLLQRLARHQHVVDPVDGLAEVDERLAVVAVEVGADVAAKDEVALAAQQHGVGLLGAGDVGYALEVEAGALPGVAGVHRGEEGVLDRPRAVDKTQGYSHGLPPPSERREVRPGPLTRRARYLSLDSPAALQATVKPAA